VSGAAAAATSGLVIGVDASTTACKAIAVDREGHVVAEGRASYPLSNPEPDGWEQDPEEWWAALQGALRGVTTALGDRASAIESIAFACQRETFVALDASGKVLHPAIVWMDARCGAEVEAIRAELGERAIHERTGKVPCTTPSLYKIRWLFSRMRPDVVEHARVADVHAYLAERLAGAFVTSGCAADPLGLVDLATGTWDDDLVGAARLSRARLPRLAAAGTKAGVVLDDVADRTGLPRGVVLAAGAGDGQAAGLGAGALEPGAAYLNVGTAIVAGRAGDRPEIGRAFRTLLGPVPGTFFMETDLLGGTFSLDWLARTLAPEHDASQWLAAREAEAATLAAGSGGLFFLPYLQGVMNPHWQAGVGGALLGLRGDHGPAHLYRAIVEGLAFETRAQLAGLGVTASTDLVAVGGAMQRPLVAGIFADVLGRPIARALALETTALGAAALAAVGAGWFDDARHAARAFTKRATTVEPGANALRYAEIAASVADGLFDALGSRLRALAATRAP
jgi:xylulokinase